MQKKIQWRKPEGKETSILIAGDFCPRERNSDYVAQNAVSITEEIKPVFDGADVRILQWETAITEGGYPIVKSGPNLRCKAECLNFAKALNIDINLLANNHTGDYGPEAAMETVRHCENAGIKTVGVGKNLEEACKPLFFDTPSGKLAVINVAENEFGIATPDTAGTAPLEPFDNIALLKKVRKEADILIIAVHGGHECNSFPSPRMQRTYRAFADAGADIVFNCHTHCIGGSEVYNDVPVIYSPGNFYFPAHAENTPAWWNYGYLSKFYCDSKGCYAYEVIPYRFDKEKVHLLNAEEFEVISEHYNGICEIIKDKGNVQGLFDAWCCRGGYLGNVNAIHEEDFPPDWNDPAVIARWIHVKNVFGCESHNDMIRRYLWLLTNYKVDESLKFKPMLDKYCDSEKIIEIAAKYR